MSSDEIDKIDYLRRLFDSNWFFPPNADPQNHDAYYKKMHYTEKNFYKNMDLELDYAYRYYESQTETFSILDTKTKTLFQFSAVAAGVLLTAARAFEINISFCFLIPMFCFILGLIFPLSAMLSADKPTGMSIKDLIELRLNITGDDQYDKFSEEHSKAMITASLDMASESMSVVKAWKTVQNDRAAILITIGLITSFMWLGFSS